MPFFRSLLLTGAFASITLITGCASHHAQRFPIDAPQHLAGQPIKATDPKRVEVVMVALSTLGTMYKWGGNHPDEGLDCSGLVNFAYARAAKNINLPRTSAALAKAGKPVARAKLRPGDLVFFNTIRRKPNSHVGIYLGEGRFINAPARGKRIRIDSLNNRYYAQRYSTARTLL